MTTVKNQTQSYELELHFKRPLFKDMVRISDTDSVSTYLRASICSERLSYKEFFWVLLLTRANSILGISEIASGNTGGVNVNIKEILQLVLLSNCSGVVVAHNHPSGRLKPSHQDISVTKRIAKALNLIDVSLLDHIIITQEDSYSLYKEGDFIRD